MRQDENAPRVVTDAGAQSKSGKSNRSTTRADHEHCREPWRTVRDNFISLSLPISGKQSFRVVWSEAEGIDVAYAPPTDGDDGNSNARRIVACVNVCAGIPTDDLERWTRLWPEARFARVRREFLPRESEPEAAP